MEKLNEESFLEGRKFSARPVEFSVPKRSTGVNVQLDVKVWSQKRDWG